MWPYEYFNQYSALINEFIFYRNKKREKRRKIFISRKYHKNKRQDLKIDKFFNSVIYKVNKQKLIVCDRSSDCCSAFLEYKFEIVMPSKAQKDDINKRILSNIIESYLVICDITPENGCFNENVMAELGMVLAWKTPEQVIVLWNTAKQKFSNSNLPFNIKNYFVNTVNFKNESDKIVEIIKSRNQDIAEGKSIIIKNIISKLDRNSLQILEKNRGLTFVVTEEGSDSREHAIRHLLNLRMIKTEIFPINPPEYIRTYGYQFTELARVVLEELKSRNVFDQRFADFMHIYHWSGHKKYESNKRKYEEKLKDFYMNYNVEWAQCDKLFKELLEAEKAHFQDDGNAWPAFECYCNGKSFGEIKNGIVDSWNKQVDRIKSRKKRSKSKSR